MEIMEIRQKRLRYKSSLGTVAPTQIGITVDAKRGSGPGVVHEDYVRYDRPSVPHVCVNEGDRGEDSKRAVYEAVHYAEEQGLLSKCVAGLTEEGSADTRMFSFEC